MWVCTCARRWDRPSVCAFVCACVYVLLCIWSPYTVIALLLRLTVRLHVNLIKKQRKPLNKLHVSSLCLPISHLASSIIRFSHLSICSLECKSISMCSLLPCLCTPSLTVCSLPVPLLLLFLHLPLLSSIRASSPPPRHRFLSPSLPCLLSCMWVVGLRGPCYPAPIQTSLSWEARRARQATGQTEWQKPTRERRGDWQPGSYCS